MTINPPLWRRPISYHPVSEISVHYTTTLHYYTRLLHYTTTLHYYTTPKFPYVPESRKKTESWTGHPQKMAESRTYHPQKMAESPTVVSLGVACYGLGHFWRVASPGFSHFRGWPVQDSVFFGIWNIEKFGGGKKDQTPVYYILLSATKHCLVIKLKYGILV